MCVNLSLCPLGSNPLTVRNLLGDPSAGAGAAATGGATSDLKKDVAAEMNPEDCARGLASFMEQRQTLLRQAGWRSMSECRRYVQYVLFGDSATEEKDG